MPVISPQIVFQFSCFLGLPVSYFFFSSEPVQDECTQLPKHNKHPVQPGQCDERSQLQHHQQQLEQPEGGHEPRGDLPLARQGQYDHQ